MRNSKLDHVLCKKNWALANLALVTKIITEFLYEEMFVTQTIRLNATHFFHTLIVSDYLQYQFCAVPRIFNNWRIDPNSIQRVQNGYVDTQPLSVSQFIVDTYSLVGIKGLTLGHFLRELNHTLVADCHLITNTMTPSMLLSKSNTELEGHMIGHPWFVINKGRLGFSYSDYLEYAPESRQPHPMNWIAVKKNHATFHAIPTISYLTLINQELSAENIHRFSTLLSQERLHSDDYYFMPIHAWQWDQQIIHLFAEDIVNKKIVYLGLSDDAYVPTQSIRTFTNVSAELKYQVKLPLSIFNTAVYRGLPSDRTRLAPLLSEWLKKKQAADIFLIQSCRLILLGEIASIDYSHPFYEHLPGVPYQYKELLGVIWRENANQFLSPNEKAITMAALIHTTPNDQPLVCHLITQSNLSVKAWLQALFTAVLPPLLHWLYKYGLVFSPHGENTLLIIDKYGVPSGLVIKDFIDDVNLSDRRLPETNDLPDLLRELLLKVEDYQLTQFIHTGLFVVLYRYLSDILQTYLNYNEVDFWQQVHDVIQQYQATFPELAERFKQYDLLRPTFKKMCLNRLRILTVGYADAADRPKVDTLALMPNPVNAEVITNWRKKQTQYVKLNESI